MESAQNSVGNTLRSERLRLDVKLDRVAAETKISRRFLEAMENDQFDRLPARFFARNFLHQYSHALGLDEDEQIVSYQRELAAIQEALPAPQPRRPLIRLPETPPSLWLAVGVLAATGVYSWWQMGQGSRHGTASRSIDSIGAARTPPGTATPARASVGAGTTSGTVSTNDPGKTQDTPGAMRVVFGAVEPVWISVTSDGVQKFSGTLVGQQSREFDAAKIIRVLVGNAGALFISLNGKPVPQLGKRGQTQLLEVTAAGARVITRTPILRPPPEGQQ